MDPVPGTLRVLSLKNVLISQSVNRVAFLSDTKWQILAIVLSNSDIVLWKTTVENTNQNIKWIPWKDDGDWKIKAITFQPTSPESISESKAELLVVTVSGSMYLLSVDKIMDGVQPDTFQNWSYRRPNPLFSEFSLYPSCPIPNFVPTAAVLWNATHYRHKNVAIIGGSNGQIIFYSLTCSHYVASLNTECKSPIFSLSISNDFFRDYCYLLVTNDVRQQWKLLLEKEINGDSAVLVMFEDYEPPQIEKKKPLVLRKERSRLQEFKQISVDTFTMLKQKLNESRKITYDRPKAEIAGSVHVDPSELQSCDCYGEAFLSVQQYRSRHVLTGLFIPDSVLLLYLQNKDSMTLIHHKFKTSSLVTMLLLTHTFIYVADIVENEHRILVFSTRLSETKKSETIEYNPASFVQSFFFPTDEQIISLFKIEVKLPADGKLDVSVSSSNTEVSPSANVQMLTKIKQSRLEDEWNEACLVVTNRGAYVISLSDSPLKLALDYVRADVEQFRKLPFIFNVPLSKIMEIITDRLVEDKNVEEALSLCNAFRCYSGKMTLKLASLGFIEELLLYTENLLYQTDLDLPLVERIHLANFVVTCYTERYLRHASDENIRARFTAFLKENRFYDEEVNIHILGNYRLCFFVHLLCVSRGLYVDCTVALTNMIAQNLNDKFKNLHQFDGFWQLFSEISLVDAFVLSPRTVHLHIYFLREHMNEIPETVLKRLYRFYNPMQPVLRPAMCRMLRSSREEYLEAYDFENDKWGSDANMVDWVTNFICLHIHSFKERNYDRSLAEYISKLLCPAVPRSSEPSMKSSESHNSISPPVLCAGFAHAALVRNGSLVTWGQSAYGCLGTGPTLSQNCAPVLNSWFEDHRIRVKNVACGKHHTLALTENGVYAWGSSRFGQLGIGTIGQSVYPRLVESLSSFMIVSIAAGQYHSLAIDIHGRLWTWGWGVYGQLGHENTDDQYYPKCVEGLKKKSISHACGGQAHTVVLTKTGKLYTFGCNTFGQLGIGTTVKSTVPVKVFGIQENIIMIATNYFHNLALSDSNRLYTWGCSPQILRLHAQSQKRARSMPNVIEKTSDFVVHAENKENKWNGCVEMVEAPVSKSIAENPSLDHPPFLTENSKHLSPTLVDTTMVIGNIRQISCGLFHSALLTTADTHLVYTWGRNMDGQLGNCKRQADLAIPTKVVIGPLSMIGIPERDKTRMSRPLWSISCGKDYTLVVELESCLFGWGNNSCGQLGSPPQEEDFNLKRFLDGKVLSNKYAKRMIKLSHGGVNVIEKPVQIVSLPKFPLLFNSDGNSPDRYLQVECDLELPGFGEPHYPIQNADVVASELDSANKILHYYLECFHRYYNAEFILQTCAENDNLQAMSKVCCLNCRFYDAFLYALKALLRYVRENYYFVSFKESRYNNVSRNRIIPKTGRRESEAASGLNDAARKSVHFEFVEDIVGEAVSMFEKYYTMVVDYTPNEVGSFLRKSISVWIVWEMPVQPLEDLLLRYLDGVAYPLTVFLFCDRSESQSPLNDQAISNSSQIENNAWKEKQLYLSEHLHKKSQPLSSKTIKYPLITNSELKMSYRNLYHVKNSSPHVESEDTRYQQTPDEILAKLSVPFTLELCSVITESMSTKSVADFGEFIRLLHNIIFSPSVLKSDDRSPDEVLSSVVNALTRNQTPRKKFIQISYEELCDKWIDNKLFVFSCSHYYTSQSDYEKEVGTVVRELDRLRLLSTSELVNRLFADANFATCCPSCLFQFVENEVSSKN